MHEHYNSNGKGMQLFYRVGNVNVSRETYELGAAFDAKP